MSISRRGFLGSAIAASVAAGIPIGDLSAQEKAGAEALHPDGFFGAGKRPIIVCANNGVNYLEDAFAFLKGGGDTLDAAIRVVKGPEDDPNDDSVGLGGLPNEEGVVELDACCMHGPTRRAGSVGGVRNVKNVALVSKAVMEHTGHVML
ncbi:MAG: isoaspartyl peptidase/L-asparaginase, partial [Terriglobales bacterium]